MEILKYIFLGIIQGIAEPLPISSSGHLFLLTHLFNTEAFSDLNFEIIVNFGSFIAIFFIFYKEIFDLIKSFFIYIFNKDKRKQYAEKFNYCIMIIIGSIPVAIVGVLFKDKIESALSKMWVLGISFLITALVLFLVRKINGNKTDKDITYKQALLIGIFQAIALVPGISRSGMVLVACLLCKLNKESSLKYTFMLYMPVSVASMVLGVKDLAEATNLSSLAIPYTVGMIAACIVTYFSYQWLSDWVKKGKLWKFSIYCLILGIFVLIYFR